MLDVAVIGAGPSGSRTAFRLAQCGYRVSVLEKRSAAGLKACCTGIISQECVSKFDIPSDIIYRQVQSATLFSPSGDAISIARADVQASVVNRSAFDSYLAGIAMNRGAEYWYNTCVDDIEVKADRVALHIKSQGKASIIEARTVILACGFNTPLVKKAGFGQSRYFTTGVQAEVQSDRLKEIEVYFGHRIAPGYFAWLVPTQNGRALAGLMSHHAAGFNLRKWLTDLISQGKIKSENFKICYSGIPMYPLSSTHQDRVLVVGDAAGQVKPSTGGGIYFGMLCADIAADTLHRGLTSDCLSASCLAEYQLEWQRMLKKELRAEYLARRLYQHISDSRIDKIFALAKAEGWVDEVMAKKQIAFDWHGQALFGVMRTRSLAMMSEKITRLWSFKNKDAVPPRQK